MSIKSLPHIYSLSCAGSVKCAFCHDHEAPFIQMVIFPSVGKENFSTFVCCLEVVT